MSAATGPAAKKATKRKRVPVPVQQQPSTLVPVLVDPPPLQPLHVDVVLPEADDVGTPPLPSPCPSSASTSSSASASVTPAKELLRDSIEKLASGEYVTRPKECKTGKSRSPAWDGFHVVVPRATPLLEVGTAKCLACGTVLVSHGGPSSLKKHVEKYCGAQLTAGWGAASTAGGFRPVPGQLRDVFVDKLADTCALSMGAVNLLTSDGVVELLQCVADIASRCKGRIDLTELMPAANTVMSRVSTRAERFMRELVPRVKSAIADRRCQGSTDMWTDDNLKQHFIEVTVSFVDEKGEATETHDLVVAKFPSTMKATGLNIRTAMYQALEDIGISREEFDGIEWVTDRGANIKKALEDLPREDCCAHIINTIVRSTLSIPYYELRREAIMAFSPGARQLLEDSESIVRAVRAARPNLQVPGVNVKDLQKALFVPQAQFSSGYSNMLQSLSFHKKKVIATLTALQREDLLQILHGMDFDLAADLFCFLSPLEKKGSVPFCDLASLKAHLSVKPQDTAESIAIKSRLENLRLLMDVLSLIKEVKDLVTFMKASGLAAILTRKVIQECETRWNTLHSMLFSADLMYDEMGVVLADQPGQQRRMTKVDRPMLKWLITFLQEFKEETKTLEGDKHPTLPLVLLVATGLRDHCVPKPEDVPHLLVLKERCLKLLGEKFQPTMKAKVANFLWPNFKELAVLPNDEATEVWAHVRTLIGEDGDGEEDLDAPPSPPKVSRHDKYNKYRQEGTSGAQPQDEVTRYLATKTEVPLELLLAHWKLLDRPDGFPKLAKLARRVLGMKATAASSERVWSRAGFVMSCRRNRLSPKHLGDIIFLGSYLRHLKNKR